MKKFLKSIFVILIVFSSTGCWNYIELNNLAIVTGIAIDKVEDEYILTVMIANSKKNNSGEGEAQSSSVIYEGKGKTIYEASQEIFLSTSKRLYISHIELLVLSEDIVKTDLLKSLDFLFRYPKVRNEFLVIISKDSKAQDILKITMPLESFPSQNVAKNLMISDKVQGYTYAVTFNCLIKRLLEEKVSPVLPSVYVVGDSEEGTSEENLKKIEIGTYLKLGMLGIFKNDKFLGYANKDESTGISIMNNKIYTTILDLECEDGTIDVEVNNSSTSFEYNLDNDIPKIDVSVEMEATIQEITCDMDLEDTETIKRIEEKSEKRVTEITNQAIKLAQENKTDIFQIGKNIHKQNYKYWNNVKENWEDEIFPKIEFNIKPKVSILTKGNISTIIKER